MDSFCCRLGNTMATSCKYFFVLVGEWLRLCVLLQLILAFYSMDRSTVDLDLRCARDGSVWTWHSWLEKCLCEEEDEDLATWMWERLPSKEGHLQHRLYVLPPTSKWCMQKLAAVQANTRERPLVGEAKVMERANLKAKARRMAKAKVKSTRMR